MYQNELRKEQGDECVGVPQYPSDLLEGLAAARDNAWGVGVGTVLMLGLIAITLQQLANKVIGERIAYENKLDAKIDGIIDRVDKIAEQIDYSS